MDLDQLIAEGKALSKPCFEISSTRKTGDIVGYWDDSKYWPLIILSETLFADPTLKLSGYQTEKPLSLGTSFD